MADKQTQGTGISEHIFVSEDLERDPLVVSTGPVTLYSVYLFQASGSADSGLKCYDVAGGTAVTAGTTSPDFTIFWDASVWGSSANRRFEFPQGITFANGLAILASGQKGKTTSGDPGASFIVKLIYK